MATKFGQRPNNFEKKLVGIVTYITGDKVAKFTLTEEGKTFKDGSTSIKVNLADLPKAPKLQPNDREGKQLRIRMSSDGTEVEALTPVVGIFNLKLVDIGPRPEGEDSLPMPREKVFKEGTPQENRYLEFFAVYEITEGRFKGVRLPAYNLHYKFEEDLPNNPGYTRFAGNFDNKKATRLFQLRDWGDIHGIWRTVGSGVEGEPIEWDDDTILPELLERALENPNVRGTMKGGYISELLPLDDEDVEPYGSDDDDLDDASTIEIEEVQETVPARAKKAPAKNGVKKISKKSKVDEDDDL